MTKVYYRNIFILILIVILVIRTYILWIHIWPINGDEAQYWNWSQYLAWGYYSKPPMIAWIIALTTKLFGNNPIGLRLGSTLAYLIGSVYVYMIGTFLFSNRIGFWSGITFILVPGISFSSTMISTDPLLIMFWCIAFYCLVRALEKNALCWWLLSSIALGFAFYSKYAAVLFSISLIIYLCFSKTHRHLWKSVGPYCVLVIPFIMLIPNMIWNYHHHFASLEAVSANADLSKNFFHPNNFLNFFLSQFAVFGPVLFISLIIIICQIKHYLKNDHYKLLLIFTLVTLGIMTFESVLSHAHANWSAPAYIAATVLVCAVIIEHQRMLWLWITLILHSLAIIGFLNINHIENNFHIPFDKEMTVTGWQSAKNQITHIRTIYPNIKILVDDRMLLTQIMYFANIPLDQVMRWNPSGQINDEYDIVTNMKNQEGKDFLLVSYIPYPISIENHFSNTKLISQINLMTLDDEQLPLYIFYLSGFKGY